MLTVLDYIEEKVISKKDEASSTIPSLSQKPDSSTGQPPEEPILKQSFDNTDKQSPVDSKKKDAANDREPAASEIDSIVQNPGKGKGPDGFNPDYGPTDKQGSKDGIIKKSLSGPVNQGFYVGVSGSKNGEDFKTGVSEKSKV